MYSILIKTVSGDKYSYYLNSDGSVYTASSLSILETKIAELLNTLPLERVIPIKNCIVTNNISIVEVS